MGNDQFTTSASALKDFVRCPRAWWLKYVARAPDDAGAGGQYLTRGNDFDVLVQKYVRDGQLGDPLAPKLANRQLAQARRHLPAPKTAEVQFSYSVDAGGFRIKGKPDLRQHRSVAVLIGDTKTTSDRGENRGAASDRPAYALTDPHTPGGNLRPLADDIQAQLYAWCEFALDPVVETVTARWVYVSKADCPHCWTAEHTFTRTESVEWFDSFVRPTVASMMAYAATHGPIALDEHERGLLAERVPANPEGCRRCFVQRACPGPFEGENVYQIRRK